MTDYKRYFKTHKGAEGYNKRQTKSLGFNNRDILIPESKFNPTKKYAVWNTSQGRKGWVGESTRHSMARMGIKTGRTKSGIVMVGRPKQGNAVLKLEKKVQNNSWKKEIDARIKKGNGFEEISDNILSKYPHLDNYEGREQIEKYYNKKYAKSDVQAGWF